MRSPRLLAIGVTLTALACGGKNATGAAGPCDGRGADFVVNANDNLRFDPANLTISAGQTVCWQNRGIEGHTVTSDDGTTFNSDLDPGEFFVRTFTAAGSFPYHCIPHFAQNMVGSVVVQ